MTQTPTDALRLVPVPYVVLSEAAGLLDCEGYGPLALTLNNLLAAAPASPLPGGGWQDISTAPKDGTLVLTWGYLHDDGGPYDTDGRSFTGETPSVQISGMTDFGWSCPLLGGHHPTHWMPLPAAPTGDA
ncbi:hypothetical protein [Brevundimonas sp.]|uniref:hypothetical protein n=1 Tax=Brevundimonas sp. TaxID=1871086 RepID=UPI0025C66858|nr:hypothetical protein [Brevundimonas sp.]